MGFASLERMKGALLTTTVTSLERMVLLDMAIAVDDDSPIYSWGHDRLALAIGKTPGTTAAKSALTRRIFPSLISKGLIRKVSDAHRGHRAEYELLVLDGPGMGTGSDEIGHEQMSRVTHTEQRMGTGADNEWVPVSEGMGTGLSGTPLPTSLPRTPTSRVHRDAKHGEDDDLLEIDDIESGDTSKVTSAEIGRSDAQVSLLFDLHIFATRQIPSRRTIQRFRSLTNDACTEVKADYWRRIDNHGRGHAYDGPEPGMREYEALSARGQQWADVELMPAEMSA